MANDKMSFQDHPEKVTHFPILWTKKMRLENIFESYIKSKYTKDLLPEYIKNSYTVVIRLQTTQF